MEKIIPFGKYKGQPVAVLSSDPDYVKWLLAQQHIKTRHPELVSIIINNFQEPSETPEHNAIQVKFISKKFRENFALYVDKITNEKINNVYLAIENIVEKYSESKTPSVYCSNENEKISKEKDRQYKILEIKNEIINQLNGVAFSTSDVEFESDGTDVSFHSYIETGNKLDYDEKHNEIMEGLYNEFKYFSYRIEIKPIVSDDFPAVLRQMKISNSNILFINSYTGIGATIEEFIDYFKSQKIRVVFEAELESFNMSLLSHTKT